MLTLILFPFPEAITAGDDDPEVLADDGSPACLDSNQAGKPNTPVMIATQIDG